MLLSLLLLALAPLADAAQIIIENGGSIVINSTAAQGSTGAAAMPGVLSRLAAAEAAMAAAEAAIVALQAENTQLRASVQAMSTTVSAEGVSIPFASSLPTCDATTAGRLVVTHGVDSGRVMCYCHDTPPGQGGRVWTNLATGAHGSSTTCGPNSYTADVASLASSVSGMDFQTCERRRERCERARRKTFI